MVEPDLRENGKLLAEADFESYSAGQTLRMPPRRL